MAPGPRDRGLHTTAEPILVAAASRYPLPNSLMAATRYRNAPGDPAYDASEAKLAAQPQISVPTIVLHGEADGVGPAAGSEGHARHFTNSYERRVIPVAGHFLPREAPEAVVAAIKKLGNG
jgi:pimeloyl-ACP methyl ester carboxylesterase